MVQCYVLSKQNILGADSESEQLIYVHDLDDSGETFMTDIYVACLAKLIQLLIIIVVMQSLQQPYGNIVLGVILIGPSARRKFIRELRAKWSFSDPRPYCSRIKGFQPPVLTYSQNCEISYCRQNWLKYLSKEAERCCRHILLNRS